MPTRKNAENWNERYRSEEYAYGKEPNGFFREFIDSHEPGRLLLPAEGEGRNAVYAAEKGWEVVAFDFSTEGRNKALKLAAERGVAFQYDITELSDFHYSPGSFDAVGLFFVHMASPMREKVHHDLVSCLKPGGRVVLEAFNKRQIKNATGGPNDVSLLFSVQELKSDFREMDILVLEELVQHYDTGIFHRGESETIRMLGRKR
ncbi:MAG: class I SAM-dependent methyltransferase [Bacteroidales bacterium]|nr:class I SAM-dependent methyltransferase [Bacteroidales bacterium]